MVEDGHYLNPVPNIFARFTGDTCILSVKTAQIYNVTLKHTELVYVQQPIFN